MIVEDRLMLLSVDDVAEQLQVSTSTIRVLVRSGRLPAYRIGGKRGPLRIRQEDVDRFLETTRVKPFEVTDDETDETEVQP